MGNGECNVLLSRGEAGYWPEEIYIHIYFTKKPKQAGIVYTLQTYTLGNLSIDVSSVMARCLQAYISAEC